MLPRKGVERDDASGAIRSYSIPGIRIPAPEPTDYTAAARIRQAALESFAERGFDSSSVRSIAAAAGVSPGLVQHHYRTKEALRRAVDRYVVERAASLLLDLAGDEDPSEVTRRLGERIGELMRSDPDLAAYVRRSLVAADTLGLELFDGLVAVATSQLERIASRGLLRSELDLTWAALHVVLMNVSTLILEGAINRHLDQPLLSDEGLRRWRDATSALFAKGQFRSRRSRSQEPTLAERDSPARSRSRPPRHRG